MTGWLQSQAFSCGGANIALLRGGRYSMLLAS
jgi:hypothetical protein